ncbi:hypothetical protein H311_01840 [Anncaliia algerae PRA109]|nr:hypothetical protein H311_01840 [Anncaliia algerae PRA109]
MDFYKTFNIEFKPKNIVGDAAPQITLIQELLSQDIKGLSAGLMYGGIWPKFYIHLHKNIVMKYMRILIIQLSCNKGECDLAVILFKSMWINFDSVSTIIEYLIKALFTGKKNSLWFEGYWVLGPSTIILLKDLTGQSRICMLAGNAVEY